MKATELMIGDWVQSGRTAARVNSLYEGGDWPFLKPVPLSSEILEKNGFDVESHENPAAFAYKKEGVSIVEVYWNGPEHGYRCIFYYGDTRLRKTCHFVHELQHALRICGVEKEIEL